MAIGNDLIVIVCVASVFCLALAGFWFVLSFVCCCRGAKKPSDEATDTDPLLSPYDIVQSGGEDYQYTKEDLAYVQVISEVCIYKFIILSLGYKTFPRESAIRFSRYHWIERTQLQIWSICLGHECMRL
jgi:hypothetical protein